MLLKPRVETCHHGISTVYAAKPGQKNWQMNHEKKSVQSHELVGESVYSKISLNIFLIFSIYFSYIVLMSPSDHAAQHVPHHAKEGAI